MSNEFDLADFDTPPDAPDYVALLDAMRDAAASGVQSATAPLIAAHNKTQRQIAELQAAERSMQTAAASVRAANSALFWENAKHLLLYTAAAGLALGGLGVGYHFVIKPAEIVQVDRYCTSWNAKKGVCNVDWKLPIR